MNSALTLLALFLMLTSTSVYAIDSTVIGREEFLDSAAQIERLATRLSDLEDRLDIYRQTQLDYKLEKEVLKENYETTVNGILITISLIGVAFTIVGAFGIQSTRKTRDEFQNELTEFRHETSEMKVKYAQARSEFSQLLRRLKQAEISESKNSARLTILEQQEKIQSFMRNQNYSRALQYCLAALELDPNDSILNSQRQTCHVMLGDLPSALTTNELRLKIDPDAIFDYLELLLLSGDTSRFKELLDEHSTHVDSRTNVRLYLNSLFAYQSNDDEGLQRLASATKALVPIETATRRVRWRFDEFKSVSSRWETDARLEQLLGIVDVLDGQKSPAALATNNG